MYFYQDFVEHFETQSISFYEKCFFFQDSRILHTSENTASLLWSAFTWKGKQIVCWQIVKKTGTDFESFPRLKFSCLFANTLNSVTYSFYKIWVSLDDGLCSLVVVVNPLADGVLPVVKVAATLQPNPHQFVLHVKHNYLHRAAHSLLKQLCLDIRVQSASLKDWLLNLFNSCRKSINKEPCALLRHGLSQEVNHHLLKWCEDEIFI